MSFDKVEVRVFSGPDQVQVGSNTEPDLIVMNIGPKGDTGATGSTGPAGPNSVTSATTSDGTGQIMLDTLAVGICNILDEVVFDTLTYTFAEGSAQALKDAIQIASADITDASTVPVYNETTELYEEVAALYDGEGAINAVNFYSQGAFQSFDGDNYASFIVSDTPISWLFGTKQFSIKEPLGNGGQCTIPDASGTFALTSAANGEPDKLTAGTISGATTFNTTSYTYGTGAAAAHRTALGLVSNTDLLSSVYEWSKSTADYSATNVGTGTSSTATNVMQLNTLATAGSSALLRSDANDFRAWQKYSGNRQAVDWSKKTMHFVRISSDAFSGADTIFRIYLGLPYTLTTVQDLQSANTAIGFKVINGVIFVQVSNGSAVTTTTTGVTMSAWLVYDCMIQSNGDGTWTATVNSTTVTGSGAPTTTSAASNAALIMSATNGSTASARRFFINTQRSMQHD